MLYKEGLEPNQYPMQHHQTQPIRDFDQNDGDYDVAAPKIDDDEDTNHKGSDHNLLKLAKQRSSYSDISADQKRVPIIDQSTGGNI